VGGGSRGALFWWALITAVISALGIGVISRRTQLKEDTAIGIIFASMFALGIAIISSARNFAVDLTHFLFGDVLGVDAGSLWLTAIFTGLLLITVVVLYKEFLVLSFDPILAATLRLPTRLLDNLLLVLIAVAIVVSLQTVGVALMVAMLVTPAASAYLLVRKLPAMMILAAVLGAASGVVGLYISYYWGIASGPAIVLTATFIFILSFLFAPQRGLLRRRRKSELITQ
ncbi:MAG: metal ABC transporter permease, partial [Chloroflexota bacterium]